MRRRLPALVFQQVAEALQGLGALQVQHADFPGLILQEALGQHLLPGALLPNQGLRFVCRQVDIVVENASTPFTRACEEGGVLSIPVKHTTGRYYHPDPGSLGEQVVFRYAPGQNPNGSLDDIAGVSNEAGNVVGLMPHPEHAVDSLTGSSDGGRLWESAVRVAV